MNKLKSHSWGMLVVLGLALATTSRSGTARAEASNAPVSLAQAPCTPKDSTVSCCVKTHPTTPERCGATKLEAAEILFAGRVAMELAKPDLPKWKRYCMGEYEKCQENDWLGSCYDCFRYCEGQQGEWPHDKCHRQEKGR